MRKILIAFLFLFGTISHSSAEVGMNIGISGALGYFEASAKEKEGNETSASKDAEGVGAIASLFVEKTITDNISLGIDWAPTAFETETTEHGQVDGGSAVTNKVQVDFTNLLEVYAMASNDSGFHAKVGYIEVDVETNESLATGSKYPDTEMDGFTIGAGYTNDLGNGAFLRAELSYLELGGVTVTSSNNSDNSVSADDITGYTAKFKIGRSF